VLAVGRIIITQTQAAEQAGGACAQTVDTTRWNADGAADGDK